MAVIINTFIECGCGCNQIMDEYDNAGRKRRFKPGHHMKLKEHKIRVGIQTKINLTGTHRPNEINKKISETMKERKINVLDKNPAWKGKDVGYSGIHFRIRNRYGDADCCENSLCSKKSKSYDWANVSGEYKLERSDWLKLCKSCHRKYDMGLLEIIK